MKRLRHECLTIVPPTSLDLSIFRSATSAFLLGSEARGILADGACHDALHSEPSDSPSLRSRLAAAATERPMNGTVLIATKFHGLPPG